MLQKRYAQLAMLLMPSWPELSGICTDPGFADLFTALSSYEAGGFSNLAIVASLDHPRFSSQRDGTYTGWTLGRPQYSPLLVMEVGIASKPLMGVTSVSTGSRQCGHHVQSSHWAGNV